MNIKNWLLKRKQSKAIQEATEDGYLYHALPYHCPKCYWGSDNLSNYTTHLENHLIKKRR